MLYRKKYKEEKSKKNKKKKMSKDILCVKCMLTYICMYISSYNKDMANRIKLS